MKNSEINEAVARRLGKGHIQDGWEKVCIIPDYTDSIQAAWEIVAFLKNHSINLRLTDPLTGWYCSIFSWVGYPDKSKRINEVETEADTAPLAICLAFLKLGDK